MTELGVTVIIMGVFVALAHLVSRMPRIIIASWALLAIVAYGLADGLFGNASLFSRLTSDIPSDPASESHFADEILYGASDSGPTIAGVYSGIDPAAVGLSVQTATADLAGLAGVESVVNPYVFDGGAANPAAAPLLAADGEGFVFLVTLQDLPRAEEKAALAEVTAGLESLHDELGGEVLIGGAPLIADAINNQVAEDLRTGELIALPIALLVMIIVFGGFLAAGMPLVGAGISIAGGLGVLLGASYLFDLEAAMVNVVTVLGLGLSIDYGLLIVSRHREELLKRLEAGRSMRRRREDREVKAALITTLTTAGRTVVFSAVIVGISLAGLGVFRPPLLRTFAIAAASVVLIAVLTAITVVPALLVLAGRALVRPSWLQRVPVLSTLIGKGADVSRDDGALSSLARGVQRHPWVVLAATTIILGVLASPLLHLRVKHTGIDMLPITNPQRVYVQTLADQYPGAATAPIHVLAESTLEEAQSWAEKIAGFDGVTAVDPPAPIDNYILIGVRTEEDADPAALEARLVDQIRADDPGFPTWVTGEAAQLKDFTDSLASGMPLALAIVIIVTGFMLFLLTGSVFIPFKAILTNVLSLAASLGVLVWGFQQGHLEGLLNFTSPGAIYLIILAMAIAIVFGLSMDYEVFLIARIKELIDKGVDNDRAVQIGLQRSGRIITSAAAIIIVVFAGFVFGKLLIIKQIGVVLAVAVFIDATIVRLLMVPAIMKIAGRWNWWAPEPLARLHRRLALTH